MMLSELSITLGFATDPNLASPQQTALGIPLDAQPVRGWLAFVASCEIIVGLLTLVDVALMNIHMWSIWHILSRQAYWLLVTTRVLGGLVGGLCIYAGIALWGKWKDSVRLARLAVTSLLVYSVVYFLARPLIIVLSARRPNDAYSVFGHIRTPTVYPITYYEALAGMWKHQRYSLLLEILCSVACLVYFRQSRRVQSTYGCESNG